LNIDYLTKKAEEFFGKRFQLSPVEQPAVVYNKPPVEKVKPAGKSGNSDEYVDFIINELGGEELS
jgi:hypothetical protein